MQYGHTPHSVQLFNYHVVFAPRYRRQLLVGERKERLTEVLREVGRDNGWEILALEAMPDHVRLFVSADAKTKPEIVVKRFEGPRAEGGVPGTPEDADPLDQVVFPVHGRERVV